MPCAFWRWSATSGNYSVPNGIFFLFFRNERNEIGFFSLDSLASKSEQISLYGRLWELSQFVLTRSKDEISFSVTGESKVYVLYTSRDEGDFFPDFKYLLSCFSTHRKYAKQVAFVRVQF